MKVNDRGGFDISLILYSLLLCCIGLLLTNTLLIASDYTQLLYDQVLCCSSFL